MAASHVPISRWTGAKGASVVGFWVASVCITLMVIATKMQGCKQGDEGCLLNVFSYGEIIVAEMTNLYGAVKGFGDRLSRRETAQLNADRALVVKVWWEGFHKLALENAESRKQANMKLLQRISNLEESLKPKIQA